ncbi:DNA-binding LacI/PurR family transcriptional regulator [Haloferula luteola]|uniref:DNA-binding LacI/PurR family transcriptional regulator n=1 Tax=Haloferula luteola TaxID=595692 RepID=A0A840UZV7_9BACT|nr:substrate-binding domain-containing protein [Haloferula luteola]MBB5350543.1 DNA-binding LacI/PurR family transcriptional regulator [Haloferula luteola]
MSEVPRKILIHDQLVSLIRDGIRKKRWDGHLPSESELCRDFQVSKMTLRKALAQLAAEKWIELGGRGKRHRIQRRFGKLRTPTDARTIRVLTPFRFSGWSSPEHTLLDSVTERVERSGFRMKVEHHPRLFERFQAATLARLDALPDTAAWVLCYSTPQIQKWFASHNRPAVVAGRVVDNLPLTSIYPDTEAGARHAAGLLVGRGHRELVYLRAKVTSIGELRASELFVAEAKRLGASARLVSYDRAREPISKLMAELLLSRPVPTAYYVGASEVALTVLCHLQATGFRVPRDVSLIAGWDDYHLDLTYPVIARYRTDGRLLGRRIGDAVMELVDHGLGRIRTIPIVPEFVPGGSVAACK